MLLYTWRYCIGILLLYFFEVLYIVCFTTISIDLLYNNDNDTNTNSNNHSDNGHNVYVIYSCCIIHVYSIYSCFLGQPIFFLHNGGLEDLDVR